ncbi:AAA family ATPase [Pseudonocardia benzenivorans]|uniref:AAA family ATPase n=1 Tax=Pseudonocardia benzenivorans TaxID=228005 RepID=A0ABW3VDZ1_9PSEU
MLYGRDDEQAALAELQQHALAGRGGALVVLGAPGAGKSALLAASPLDGLRVLRTQGVEAESPLAFAALHRLLRPLRHHMGRLPARQARALRAAFGEEDDAPDPYLVYLGALSLVAEAAAEQPLLLVVDDAHWLDDETAAALLFVARRLADDPVALLFAAREQSGFDPAELPVLPLAGLDRAAASAVLAERAGAPVPDAVLDVVLAQTGGNPLALAELPTTLGPDQLSGATDLPGLLPLSARVEAAFLDRARDLDPDAAAVLLLVAADDTGDVAVVEKATTRSGLPAAAFEAAERTGLFTTAAGEIVLRHPLVRSAVYAGATATERRRAHRALAEVVTDPQRRAWHLAAAADGTDETAAAALVKAGERARARGGHSGAAAAFARAADLTPDPAVRGARRAKAALAAWLAGRPQTAADLADRALAEIDDPVLHAETLAARARTEWNTGSLDVGQRMVLEAAQGLADLDPSRARELAVLGAGLATVGAHSGIDPTTVVPGAAPDAPARDRCVDALLNGLHAIPAADWGRAAPALQTAIGFAHAIPPGDVDVLPNLGIAALHLQADDDALRLHDRLLADARSAGATVIVLYALTRRALAEVPAGRWTAARTSLSEAVEIARATGRPELQSFPEAQLVLLDALCGNGSEDDLDRTGETAAALSLGTVATTVRDLLDWARAQLAGVRTPTALARLGRLGPSMVARSAALDRLEAAAAADGPLAEWTAELEHFAEGTGSVWAAAVAAHGRALLTGDTAHFDRAVDLHARSTRPFDAARTRLAYGEHLRRAGRRVDARGHLRAAMEAFDTLGARTWYDLARRELRASGATARRRSGADTVRLTPTELQVARLVAEGMANRDVAAQLFVSPRTVDFHLRNIFTKTGISSRRELGGLALS